MPRPLTPPDPPTESIGALLTRLRLDRGFSQLRLAELLCATAGVCTVSRHEVSRWEREERVPGRFWLGWLAAVLDAPLDELESAVLATRRGLVDPGAGRHRHHRLWQPVTAADLLTALDQADPKEVQELAHAWLAGPPEPGWGPDPGTGPAPGTAPPPPDRTVADLEARLHELRRSDDLVGGADLAGMVDAELRAALRLLPAPPGGTAGRRVLRLVAGLAQLTGWVYVDAGQPVRAQRAYAVGLRAAAAGADRPLAAHVLGSLSHLCLAGGDPHWALLLARTGHAGARRSASARTQALLLHRIALAAAGAGERRAADTALAAAERVSERGDPAREPAWLYWLDETELAAMTGRCLAALARPLRAEPLLRHAAGGAGGEIADRPGAAARRTAGVRSQALYAGWLARTYLDLGEVEQACQVAAVALVDAVRAGSVRAAAAVGHLDRDLLRHRELPAVRRYLRFAEAVAGYLPAAAGAPRRPVRLAR